MKLTYFCVILLLNYQEREGVGNLECGCVVQVFKLGHVGQVIESQSGLEYGFLTNLDIGYMYEKGRKKIFIKQC